MSKYTYEFENGEYVFYKNDRVLKTVVGNNVVKTSYKPLADRMIKDLDKYGEDFRNSFSIISWHYTLLDKALPLGHKRFEEAMIRSFLTSDDWYAMYGVDNGADYMCRSVEWQSIVVIIKEWLSKMSLMQIVAACCIANAYESLYVAFNFALLLESTDNAIDFDKFKAFFEVFPVNLFGISFEEFYNEYKTFELYYGFHLKENGKILDKYIEE